LNFFYYKGTELNKMGESTSPALESEVILEESIGKSNSKPIETIVLNGNNVTTKDTTSIGSENLSNASHTKTLGDTMSEQKGSTAQHEKKATSNVSAKYGNYDDYQILPEAPWPPPIFIRQGLSPQERYYLEHRWYSQWSFFDSKATQNKNRYYRTQVIVGLGSVTVPVLVGINASGIAADVLYFVTVFISLSVAMATAIEALYTFGDNWRSYRSAAEDLHQEKSLYDVKAGRYTNNNQAFIRFVERCEEIIAQQNGRWVQSQEKAAEQIRDEAEDVLDRAFDATDQFGNPISATATTTTTVTTEPTFTPGQPMVESETYTESYQEMPTNSESIDETPVDTEAFVEPTEIENYSDPDTEDPMTPTSIG
jgi:hypothetical protein